MNDEPKRLAYVSAGERSARYASDYDALIESGFSRVEIWPERDLGDVLDEKYPARLMPGDIIVIAKHDSIGGTVRKRNALLTRLARLGIMVEVLGSEPVLYDADEKLIEYNVTAKRQAKAELLKATKPSRGRGRPSPYAIPEADKRYICLMWANLDIERDEVRQQAAELAKRPVPDHVINRWCGPRSKPTDKK